MTDGLRKLRLATSGANEFALLGSPARAGRRPALWLVVALALAGSCGGPEEQAAASGPSDCEVGQVLNPEEECASFWGGVFSVTPGGGAVMEWDSMREAMDDIAFQGSLPALQFTFQPVRGADGSVELRPVVRHAGSDAIEGDAFRASRIPGRSTWRIDRVGP